MSQFTDTGFQERALQRESGGSWHRLTVLLGRVLTSELSLSENTEPDTGEERATSQEGDPGTGQGSYGP